MAGTAVRGRLSWHVATVAAVTEEDGYSAERSYSIASADGEPVAITVERLEDGEVSPYLTQELRPGDQMEVSRRQLGHERHLGCRRRRHGRT
jgi:hypothetical protein